MAHTIYENFVLENKIEDLFNTHLDLNQFCTQDNSLTENAGMKKKIHTYTATGNVEDLAMGVGNSGDIEVSFTEAEYEVETTQGRFAYFDEQEMQDPMVVEAGLEGVAAKMANDLTSKIVAELDKATLTRETTAVKLISFADVVDSIALFNTEDEAGLYMLVSPADLAALRKGLADDLKYVEAFARTGYVGSVCGVPVYVSKAVPAAKAFIASKEAVTVFTKKGSEIEQERDANIRKNTIYGRKVALVALTDGTKVVELDIKQTNA